MKSTAVLIDVNTNWLVVEQVEAEDKIAAWHAALDLSARRYGLQHVKNYHTTADGRHFVVIFGRRGGNLPDRSTSTRA